MGRRIWQCDDALAADPGRNVTDLCSERLASRRSVGRFRPNLYSVLTAYGFKYPQCCSSNSRMRAAPDGTVRASGKTSSVRLSAFRRERQRAGVEHGIRIAGVERR